MPRHINPHLLPPANRYFSQAWRKRARAQLRSEPLCRLCAQKGLAVAAECADHIDGHTDGESWDTFLLAPLQSLCKACHDGAKQRLERLGYSPDIGPDGWPLDVENHPTHVRTRSRR
jgi:5-methylcytosine-specific restriction protein A